jgi:cupin 2 domain-containing protein
MKKSNLYTNIDSELADECFDTLVNNNQIRIERIVSQGHTSPENGWYDQKLDEWVAVLKGSATLEFYNGSVIELEEGDYIKIPAHRKHRVTRTSEKPNTIWLAIHYHA